MGKYIIIALLILLALVYHLDNQPPATKAYDRTLDKSYSDRSQCTYQRPTVEEKIRTNFAGYVLEYPCTAEPKSINKHYSASRNRFKLKLFLVLRPDKESIWPEAADKNHDDNQNFMVKIFTKGNNIESPAVNALLENVTKVKTIESAGLEIYTNSRRVTAHLKNHKDAIDNHPVIKCTLEINEEIGGIFTDSYHRKSPYANCRAYWMLRHDIAIILYNFKASYAYQFEKIYQSINLDLQKMIVKKPSDQSTVEQ